MKKPSPAQASEFECAAFALLAKGWLLLVWTPCLEPGGFASLLAPEGRGPGFAIEKTVFEVWVGHGWIALWQDWDIGFREYRLTPSGLAALKEVEEG